MNKSKYFLPEAEQRLTAKRVFSLTIEWGKANLTIREGFKKKSAKVRKKNF